jgi:hypothetical protein
MALDERYHAEWATMSRCVRELFQNCCARCLHHGHEETATDLQVHHIDENPSNNQLENLIPLCARCHLQIEKEARRHAPYQAQQVELFTESSYTQAMQQMRQQALQSLPQQQGSPPEDFEAEEWMWEQEMD